MTTALPSRHLSIATFADYLRAGVPVEHPIPGTPRTILFIDTENRRIGLRAPAAAGETGVDLGLESVSVHIVQARGERLTEVRVVEPRLFGDAYPVLCAVADRVQLRGETLTTALHETLQHLGHLLRPEDRLPRETEISLIGELTLLARLIPAHGAPAAVAAWRGGLAEEHDFGLDNIDVEVKTTTSERRAHWISSLTQLVPTGCRPLWLVSWQITRSGTAGRTLPQVIESVRKQLTGFAAEQYEVRLQASGWHDHYSRTLTQPWTLRFAPAAYRVGDQFPRLTPRELDSAGVDLARLIDVRYRIDLAGLTPDAPPNELAAALTTERDLP